MIKRDNQKCIYTSSYDRGLQHLLEIWPEVKKAVPKATLEIAYGWQLFASFYADNPASMSWKAKMDEMMTYDGITHHGRLPQHELKEWYEKCGIWAYPTHFGEISCISAMKAQAWGAIPVTMSLAALQTTVQYGVKVDGDIYEPKTKELYKELLIEKLKDDNWQDTTRPEMMAWARKKFSWKSVAEQWSREFGNDEYKEAIDVILKEKSEAVNYLPVQLQAKYGYKETY